MPRKPKPENVEVGKRLARLRSLHGYETMRAMAGLLNVHEDTWRAWELGHNEFPVDMARRLKDRWGVSLEYLYTGQEVAMSKELIQRIRKAA